MHQTKTGILLANLGTPDAPTPGAVKRYLRQFLSDKRVVDTSRLLWWPLLRGVILPIRSPRVAKLYQSVWMEEGSPLMVYSRRQQQALAARLPDTPVALGMSYGSPSLASAVDDLLAQGVEHIVVLPLYPQYSCSTVAAVWDELARILAKKARHSGYLVYSRLCRTSGLYPCAGGQRARFLRCPWGTGSAVALLSWDPAALCQPG
ncbi:ferrochelatase [Klebsiella pneumoniae]|nr:ferrochelatase [Klebsiella pneumoniae]